MLSGEECVKRVQNNTKYVMSKVAEGKFSEILDRFGYADKTINVGDFYYFLADISAGAVQGNRRKAWCDELTAEVFDANDQYMTFFVRDQKAHGPDLEDYDSRKLSDTTIDFDKNSRQWVF